MRHLRCEEKPCLEQRDHARFISKGVHGILASCGSLFPVAVHGLYNISSNLFIPLAQAHRSSMYFKIAKWVIIVSVRKLSRFMLSSFKRPLLDYAWSLPSIVEACKRLDQLAIVTPLS